MTGLSECNEVRQALGVYVLGAIDPAERSIVDAHLPHCLDCREELAGLAGLPALLGRVPVAEAARFNFTFDFSGGVQIVNSNRGAFTIGYKYQHISNANRANANPGVDVQMIFAGFSVFK